MQETSGWQAVWLTALSALCAACGGAGPAPVAGATQGQTNAAQPAQQSTNWSGYLQTGPAGRYRAVSGSWVVPAVDCTGAAVTASAAWTGIGGSSASDLLLIQAGTEQDCTGSGADYYAWWEAFPAPSMTAGGGLLGRGDFPVQPGDRISVTVDGGDLLSWKITIVNATRGWTFHHDALFVTSGDSAEWILEAPTAVGLGQTGQTTLSKFGRIGFFDLTANGQNPKLASEQRVELVDGHGAVLANPSAARGGDAFDVCYGAHACD
jgi:hypothetical protein